MKVGILKDQLKERGYQADTVSILEKSIEFTFGEMNLFNDKHNNDRLKPFIDLIIRTLVPTNIYNRNNGDIVISINREKMEDYIIELLITEKNQTTFKGEVNENL